MPTNQKYKNWKSLVAVVLTIGEVLLANNHAGAQIIPDHTLGGSNSIVQPINSLLDRINGGVIRGSNLFHSFQEFNIGQGQSVYFTDPTGVTNIFSRVTGSNPSQLLGTLGVAGNANLFFLNPNGIIFEPNAKLDISGSFVASTANSVVFPNGMQFSASNPEAPPLLRINLPAPIRLQFASQQPGALVNTGNLAVGQNLSLVGGTIVSTGTLSAPNGELAVVTVPGIQADGSTPVVNLGGSGQFLNWEISPSTSGSNQPVITNMTLPQFLANPLLTNVLTVNSGGQAALNGSNLPVVQGDIVAKNANSQTGVFTATNNLTLVESTLQTSGDLQLLAQNTVLVRDSVVQAFVAQALGNLLVQGNQGIDISALNNPNSGLLSGQNMVLRSANTVGGDAHFFAGGSFQIEQLDGNLGNLYSPHDPIIRANGDVSFDSYTGASLDIFAGGSVTLIGNITINSVDTAASSVLSSAEKNVTLSDGNNVIQINGSTVDIRAGTTAIGMPSIQGSTTGFSPNPPNTCTTATSADITIDGSITNNGGLVFLTNQYYPNKSLAGGAITVGGIETAAGNNNSNSGDIAVDARSNIIFTGNVDSSTPQNSNSTGNAGTITIDGNSLNISNGVQINAITYGSGQGGNITLNVSNTSLTGNNSGIFAGTFYGSTGLGGTITMNNGNSLNISDGAQISTDTYGTGQGGSINLTAGSTTLTGNNSSTNLTGIFAETHSTSPDGGINIKGNSLNISDGAQIAAGAYGTSPGGNITLNVSNTILTGNNSGIFTGTYSSGNSGTITINNGSSLNITNGAQIGAGTYGAGNGGNITLNVSNTSLTGSNSGIFAGNTTRNSTGNGGGINIKGNSLNISDGAQIGAGTYGAGNGGNITLDLGSTTLTGNNSGILAGTEIGSTGNSGTITMNNGNSLNISDGAQINAFTYGSGQGGNIMLNVDSTTLTGNNSQIISGTSPNSTNPLGAITIKGSSLYIKDGAQIGTSLGSGQTANINVKVDNIQLTGNTSQISSNATTSNGGDITLNTDNITLTGNNTGVFSNSTSTGNAGSISINGYSQNFVNNLSVSNSASIGVNSQGTGTGGNITVAANDITLNNGTISATSNNNTGGNITLTIQDLLEMQNNSTISATAGNGEFGGNGGTINILGSPFIVAFPSDINSIIASATQGQGGNIYISTKDIFAGDDSLNISASSTYNKNGQIAINTSGIDPTKDLAKLPQEVIRPEDEISQSPCQPKSTNNQSELFNLGRGGLPPNPSQSLNSNEANARWVEPDKTATVSHTESKNQLETMVTVNQAQTEFIPARGWERNEKDEVILVSYNTDNQTPERQVTRSSTCSVP